jgi:hypothetical protein
MRTSLRTLFFLASLAFPIVATNCGGGTDGNTFGAGPSGSGTGGAGGNGGGQAGIGGVNDASAGTSILGTIDANSGRIILGDGEVCAGEVATAVPIPLDMFIMLDQSTSMNETLPNSTQTRWQAVTSAIVNFLNTPQATQLGVGIGYFGLPAVGGTPGASSCDVNAYATPDVEIGALSDPTVVTALTSSIGRHAPSSFTPTGPALAGAILHAQTWAAAHPDRPTIVVLATDGFPSTCMPSDLQVIANDIVAPAASAAADSATNSRIRTFVIAAGNDSGLAGLQAISSAGGTGGPFVVIDSANSGAQITQALVDISHTNLACSYAIPIPDAGLDPTLVNVRITRSGQAPVLLDLLKPGTLCTAAGGFFYDDAVHPTHLSLCPATCDSLVTGQIDIVVGCPRRGPN